MGGGAALGGGGGFLPCKQQQRHRHLPNNTRHCLGKTVVTHNPTTCSRDRSGRTRVSHTLAGRQHKEDPFPGSKPCTSSNCTELYCNQKNGTAKSMAPNLMGKTPGIFLHGVACAGGRGFKAVLSATFQAVPPEPARACVFVPVCTSSCAFPRRAQCICSRAHGCSCLPCALPMQCCACTPLRPYACVCEAKQGWMCSALWLHPFPWSTQPQPYPRTRVAVVACKTHGVVAPLPASGHSCLPTTPLYT